MKKSLLATTALAAVGAVAIAGPAAAQEPIQVTVGGYMEQWFGYAINDEDIDAGNAGFDQQTDAEIHFEGETTLDNGLTFGINVQLEAQTEGDQIDEQFAYVEGSFGRFVIGSENHAAYLMHYGIPSYGAGIDSGDASNWVNGGDFRAMSTNPRGPDNDAEKITYFTPRFAGFQAGASYIPNIQQDVDAGPDRNDGIPDDGWAVAANYNNSFGEISVQASAGYASFGEDEGTNTDGEDAYAFGLRLGFAGFVASGTYGEEVDTGAGGGDEEQIGAGLSYGAGPFGVSLAYIGSDNDTQDSKQDVFELGAQYKLGPGVAARGSVYYLDREVNNNHTADGYAVVGGLVLGF